MATTVIPVDLDLVGHMATTVIPVESRIKWHHFKHNLSFYKLLPRDGVKLAPVHHCPSDWMLVTLGTLRNWELFGCVRVYDDAMVGH